MNSNLLTLAIVSGSLLALAGCVANASHGVDGEGQVGSSAEALSVGTSTTTYFVLGFQYNLAGRDLNGTALNGKVLDGHFATGAAFDGASLDGAPLAATWLDGSELHGIQGNGKHLRGASMIGAVFTASLDDGAPLEMRLDGVEAGVNKWDKDVMRYEVSYPTADGFVPLCGLDANGAPVKVLALAGRWDYRQGVAGGGSHIDDPGAFTFSCDDRALAKCVELGYKPWQAAMSCPGGKKCERITLADLHQSCTRMLRADYCGDGTSYTVDGTALNAYDAFGIRTDGASWAIEAEWGPAGALCVSRERIASAPTPPCAAALDTPDCGDVAHFGTGTLLISEVNPATP